jgi:hypothetical protein
MKKIIAVMAIATASCIFFLNNSTGSAKVSGSNLIACDDYYANDTTPKKHKRKSDTTRRDTTVPALAVVTFAAK